MVTELGKILILTHYDILAESGGDMVRAKRIEQLLGANWKAKTIGFSGYSSEIRLPKLLPLLPFWVFSTARTILSGEFEWLYIINDRYLVLLCHFLRKISLKKFRIAYDCCLTARLLKRKSIKAKAKQTPEHFAFLISDLIVTTSEQGQKLLADFQEKLVLVPNFVDTETFQRDQQKGLEIRQRYGLSPQDNIVGVVGPFDNIYNRSFLAFLREKAGQWDNRIKFLIIGKYNQQDFFKAENIIWAGHVPDYIANLSALDCLLLPRTIITEGAMNKALEAMAMEIPVFTTPVGYANLEHVTPNEHIFVFPEEEIPAAMNRLLFDTETMMRVGKQARVQIEYFYSSKLIGQRLLQRLQLDVNPR